MLRASDLDAGLCHVSGCEHVHTGHRTTVDVHTSSHPEELAR